MRRRAAAEDASGQFGAHLAMLRRSRGLTQAELSSLTGLAQATISDLEAGRVHFSWHYAKTLAPAFGTTPGALARLANLLPEGVPTEEEARLDHLQREYPKVLAFLARADALSSDGRLHFNIAMQKVIEMEELFFGEKGKQGDDHSA